MSGIVGIYNLDGRPVEQTDIQRMVDSIAHRGPDGSGTWTDGSVGLGHRMLWTTPESLHEKLPLTNKAGNLTITADARVDNRDELIPTLNFKGRPHETIPDSEIILAAYEKWGEMCPEKLLGDFSFAIYDKRKQIIYCARDPIGIKPFYYYFEAGKFRWSSEPKAIFEDKTISKEPNLPLICLYLLNRFDEREETLYKDVFRLPPSHFMVLENGRIRKDQYWDVDPNYAIRYKTDEEYAEHFFSLFKDAVQVRLRNHGPVGALLSGGLDSSSVVCTAQFLYQEKSIPSNGFETFSIVFDEFPCDERPYIDEVIRKWNVKASCFTYEKNLSWVDFEQIEQYPDVGYFPNLLFWGPIFRDARQKGVRIMVDGIGGDDFLAVGFNHLTDLFLQGKIGQLRAQLWYDAIAFSYSPYSLFLDYCLKPLIPRPIKEPFKRFLRPLWRDGIPSWLNNSFLNKTELIMQSPRGRGTLHFPTRAQQQIYDVFRYGWNHNIALEMIGRFETYFGIESRHPFLDRRLIEFCFAIPENQRWSTEWPKRVLRNTMRDILPAPIRNRKGKAEFSPIIDHEFKQRQANKLDALLEFSTLGNLGVIHSDRFHRIFQGYRRQEVIDYDKLNDLETFVWLELWLQSALGVYKKGDEKND